MSIENPADLMQDQANNPLTQLDWLQVFNAMSDLVLIVDCDCSILYVNRVLADRLHAAPAELIGRKCFEMLHATASCPDFCPHLTLLESHKSQTAEFESEILQGVFEVNCSPLIDESGRFVASVHVLRDITEKRRHEDLLELQRKQFEEINNSLEARINEAVAELRTMDGLLIQQSRLSAMSEMISNIAHQWRQPLNNIGLIVQNLKLAFKANDLMEGELDENISEIMQVLQQISDTINDFRNFFSRDEDASIFVVNEVIVRALSFIKPSMKSKGINVEIEGDLDVTANGYPNQYAQALLNIIQNSKDVLLEKAVEDAIVTIRIFTENGRSVVTILDNGGGINADVVPKIFDPYFTTKKQGRGSGIGLFMAKMIIEKNMNGIVSVRNVNDGTEFRIEV